MNVPKDTKPKGRGGVKYPFPERLFDLLEDIDTYKKPHLASILSWDPNGRNFTIHDRLAFQRSIQNKYFNQSKFASFRRQLNLWGFERVLCDGQGKGTRWTDQNSGSYSHPLFQRHDRSLCSTMTRSKLKKEEADTMQISSQKEKSDASFQSKRTNDFNLPNFPLLFQEEQKQALLPQQTAPRERSISNSQFYGDQENSLLLFQDFNMKLRQDDDEQNEKKSSCSNDDGGEPLPFDPFDSFENKVQVNSAEEECGGNDQSFKKLLDFLSDCDENIYKFLLGDHHQEE
ncbi:hypothetical protein CTEN210_13460 [Chaetoceros tenuissimus]|uniref:HSF-type DNA-binding domain-containing protein n=1 Tax=Chaetoceros tenuissimus TaxID=426638 RepID=A0AAD3D6P0_9STRA|nr:hypothetical protein CTEN210_13460 [Chaetoceros tenuissimus]